MTLLEVGLAIAIAYGGAEGPTIDITPRVHLGTPDLVTFPWAPRDPKCGVALPHLAITSTHRTCGPPELTARHETGHLEQYEAIGPGVLLAHVGTRGEAIEDYLGTPSSTWRPPPGQTPRCPLVRITPSGWRFAPCWNPTGGTP